MQLEDPAMGSLMVTLAALFGLVGASGALLLAVLWVGVFFHGDWAPWQVWLVPAAALLLAGPGAVLLAERPGRVWFRKRSAPVRQAIAAGAWAAAVGAFLAFMMLVTTL